MRIQNIVGSWTADDVVHVAERVPRRIQPLHARRFPPTNSVPSMQDLGVRLPIYPTDPSISEINASGFFNIGDNLDASFVRDTASRSTTGSPGRRDVTTSSSAAKCSATRVEIRQPVPAGGTLHLRRQHDRGTGHALADFLLGHLRHFDQGTGEYKDYKVFYGSSFVQDDLKVSDTLTLNLGVRFEHSPPWHEIGGPHHALVRRRLQRQRALDRVPAGAARRNVPRRRGFRRYEGTEASVEQLRARASALRGTSPATARPAFAAAAACSTTSTVTANRAMARSTRRRSAFV